MDHIANTKNLIKVCLLWYHLLDFRVALVKLTNYSNWLISPNYMQIKVRSNHQTKLNVAENKFDMVIWSGWEKSL